MRNFVRWWETLGRPERIVALAVGCAAPVAIVNSAVWAIAVCYMAHEKARVEIERLRAGSAPLSLSTETADDIWQATATASAANAASRSH